MIKIILKRISEIVILGGLTLTLTGCETTKDEVKEYAKEPNDISSGIVSVIDDDTNETEKNNTNETENNKTNETEKNNTNKTQENNKVNNLTENKNNTVVNNNVNYDSWIGKYQTDNKYDNSVHSVDVLIQNIDSKELEFAINGYHGRINGHVNVGMVKGVAYSIGNNSYEFKEISYGETYKITFKLEGTDTVEIIENYANDINIYGGDGVSFAGKHKRNTQYPVKILDEFGNIYYSAKEVKTDDFIKLWDNSSDPTELAINKDGTFLIDHYTKASEVAGKYEIKGTTIVFTNNNGEKWKGEILKRQSGENVLIIEYNGEKISLYDCE